MNYNPAIDGPIDPYSVELRRIMAEIANRKVEGLKLYRPMPFQQAFHDSMVSERIIRGGNRAGKTLAAAVEIARAITGQDPMDRYPKKNGVCYCVGKDGREVSQVLFQLLFRPGAFRIIRDTYTKEWRSYDPENEQDKSRFLQSRPSLPLVPKRLIQSIAWEDKKTNLPKQVSMTNGWQVHFYSSNGKPTHGTSIDLAWFDEEILDRDWYGEVAARLVDRMGRFIWSATPQAGTERLYALYERAMDQIEKNVQPRTIEHFFCTIDGNKHMTPEAREQFTGKFMEDEENYRVRVGGEFAIISGRVYKEYYPKLHEIDPFPIPQGWTRYVAIDPGRQVCASLFAAVPPPGEGDYLYFYDELYIRDCSAADLGREMGKKAKTQQFRLFLIDMHEARKHDSGSGKKIVEQYTEQFKKNNVKSTVTGYEFLPGNDNTAAGIESVKFALRMRENGLSKIRVFRTLTNFIKEIKHYRNKRIGNDFIDDPVKKNDHLMDCARYLVQYNPTWIAPKKSEERPSGAYKFWLDNKAKERKKHGNQGLVLGPGDGDVTRRKD